MKKTCIILFFLSQCAFAQKFFNPRYTIEDSLQLSKYIKELSSQLILSYPREYKQQYFDNLYRFQNLTEQYQKSLYTLDTLCTFLSNYDSISLNSSGFPFRVFAEAKLIQERKQMAFDIAFEEAVDKNYKKLNSIGKISAAHYFEYEVEPLKVYVNELLKSQENLDSISLESAKNICRAYNTYDVYNQLSALGKKKFKEIEYNSFDIRDSILIKMRDGSLVSAFVVKSRNKNYPMPVILNFSIYPRTSDKSVAKIAVSNGYTAVVAYTRGKHLSPDDIEPFEHDSEDAYDVIDWISKQSWCNGKVGMYGGSYLGFTQMAAAKNIHPALKTIVPLVPVGIGISFPLSNSIFKSYMLRWIRYVTNNKETDEKEFNNDSYWDSVYNNWYTTGSAFKTLDSVDGRTSKIFQRWLSHPSYDRYWQNMIPNKNEYAKINIPTLITTGYYDEGQLGSMNYLRELSKGNQNKNLYFLIGPYDHTGAQSYSAHELLGYKIDLAAHINIVNLTFGWFNYILKDSLKPTILKDKINFEVMGTNKWKHVGSLEKMNNDTLTFYLSNIQEAEFFKLTEKKALKTKYISQQIDYKDRSNTSYSETTEIVASALETGKYLSFISDTIKKPFSINGSFFGEIKTIINKKDYDLNIKLYEQKSDGSYFYLSSFLGRASYAKDKSKRQLLTPGKEQIFAFSNSFFTSKQLEKGSRLVILVGVNKNPYWQINYGTGKDVSDETIEDGKVPLEIQWMTDSHINIPIWRD